MDHLAQQVLAQVLAFDRIDRQRGAQFVEALQKQRVAFFRNLLGFTDSDQNTAQEVELDESLVEHNGSPLELKQNGRRSI
ncbi:hypothetical protein D3C80_1846390 [compost metagenome]